MKRREVVKEPHYSPSIVAGGRGNSLHIGVVLLNSEEMDIMVRRVKEVLK